MNSVLRRAGVVAAVTFVAAYAVAALRGPQGIPALVDKRREIRLLQEQNATLARENQRKRERIDQLKNSPEQQELEVRKQLKLLRKGETSFILPEGAAPAKGSEPAPEPSSVQ